ncbi:hypothetical protein PN398_13300 [Romboutsia sp. 1001216sp1]|uniref:hypothetical protein n=1 Tax=Romboutsia sp. 1001216sp1 TaxID=2986997 RepID=UPI00232D2E9F|nr:hypothetical protein [Romboutsia sp. 1001216sp1]MDB8791705.1 hypothetical protein [Romboutsia sp. 1001216sp1]
MRLKPTIDQYLLSTCLFIIDEFNELYENLSAQELKQIADEKYNEMDICVRIGYPFRNMVHYTVGDNKKKKINTTEDGTIIQEDKINHDLYIESKDFKIEVKFLKNWKSTNGTYSCSKNWKEFKHDFDWLERELEVNKGKRAFVIGWFNCVDKFSQLIQLGGTKGGKPLVDDMKLVYFPFLYKMKIPTFTTDLNYDYREAYKSTRIKLIGEKQSNIDCLFLGNEKDKFHFVIYY